MYKSNQSSLLLHPVFITSIVVLLVNDHYWKYEYHNAITGKLSDIAGLVILPLFLSVLFPRYKLQMFLLSAFFFAWWKSPWSTSVINWLNTGTGWHIGRTIDPTDLLALLVLPLVWKIKAKEQRSNAVPLFRNLAITLSAVFTFMSLCATTCIRHLQTDEPIYTSGDFRTRAYAEDIVSVFNEHHIVIRRDTVDFKKIGNNNLFTPLKDSSGATQMAPVNNIYIKSSPPFPTFTIPELIIGNDTLHEVRFHVEWNNRNYRKIRLQSFRYNGPKVQRNHTQDDRILEKQFRKPILTRLKEVLK